MLTSLLEKFGFLEVALRCTITKMPALKNRLKKRTPEKENPEKNDEAWQLYKDRVHQIVGHDSIVLIHSAVDEFLKIGISIDEIMGLIRELVADKNTVVIPAFPISNQKPVTQKTRPYDPCKTLCWTGMLPNKFIAEPGVKRSVYPFNSLAALGPEADNIIANNRNSLLVYDEYSAWSYCVKHHAKILFLGSPAHSSNTIAIHMIPDVMGYEWPIDNWYTEVDYPVRIDGTIYYHRICYQSGKWYKYVEEYATNKFLKDANILKEEAICGCYLGSVHDSKFMVDSLVTRCRNGKLMYRIPRRDYKKRS